MPFVKVVIYVSANPLLRISKCDILCILNTDEEARIAGIYKRNSSKDPSQYAKTMSINLN
nr:hypothetical protein [uncultured Campylobacter sp.]